MFASHDENGNYCHEWKLDDTCFSSFFLSWMHHIFLHFEFNEYDCESHTYPEAKRTSTWGAVMFLSHIHHLICANCVVFIYEVCFFIHIFFCVLFGTDRANPDDFFGCWYFSLLFMSVNVECQRWFQCEMCVCVCTLNNHVNILQQKLKRHWTQWKATTTTKTGMARWVPTVSQVLSTWVGGWTAATQNERNKKNQSCTHC